MTDFDTSDREVHRAIRSWLHEDLHEDASRVAGAVLDQVGTTPQRRATWWRARRFTDMNTLAKVLVAAAAVVVVAVVGMNVLPGLGGGVGSQPTPSPTATPTLAPVPTSGPIDAGTYVVSDGQSSFRVTFPAGWDSAGGTDFRKHRDTTNEVTLTVYSPEIDVWPDACATEGEPQPAGSTVDDLLTALDAQENAEVSEPSDVTIGGRPGKRIDVAIPSGLDVSGCTPDVLRVWVDDTDSYLAGLGPNGSAPVTMVEGPSGRVVFVTGNESEASAADVAELGAIVDSIQFPAAP